MKSFLQHFALQTACVLASFTIHAQTKESFNSRSGVEASQVIEYLQQHCWQFSNFSASRSGQLEGDASLVSVAAANEAGFYTPAVNVWGDFTLSFNYSFNSNSAEGRSVSIYLTNANNEIVSLLESIDVSTAAANTVYTYNKTLHGNTGIYKIHVSYQGGSHLPLINMDNLYISASPVYTKGCNEAPKALSDIIVGDESRHASGNVADNDSDPNGESMSTYLITDSKDGHVVLDVNGHFTFTPAPGFTGNATAFTYQVCDHGYNQLCSQEVTVILTFPNIATTQMADLQANYVDKAVSINWSTASEFNSDRFEIERSTDGSHFEKSGVVKAMGVSNVSHSYVFHDMVSESTTRKNDLFYRLKQIDRDGKTSYSKMLVVRVFKTKTIQAVAVSPNPAVNDIKVQLQLNEPAYVVMKLRKINGEEITRKTIKAYRGENSYAIEGSERFAKGVYMLEVIVNSNERMVVKLIKN